MCMERNKELVDDILYNSLPSWIHNTCGIAWSEVLQTPFLNAKMWESKSGTYFYLTLGSDVPPRLSGAEVRETEICVSHVRASLLHHLLFGPTLSGEERRVGEAGKRWSVTHGLSLCFIRFPFRSCPVCDSRWPRSIHKDSSNWTGWELILTQKKVWAVFAPTSLRRYGNHLYFLQYLFTWVIELLVLRVESTNCTWPFTVFPSIWLSNSLPTDLDRLLMLPHNNKHWPLPA